MPNQIYMLRKNNDTLKRIYYFPVSSKERMGLERIHLLRLSKALNTYHSTHEVHIPFPDPLQFKKFSSSVLVCHCVL